MNLPSDNPASTLSAPMPWQLAQWKKLSRALAADSLAHAYLLCGAEGLGKALFADAFARYALCLNPVRQVFGTEKAEGEAAEVPVACSTCANCLKCGEGNHPDIIRISIEEGSKNLKIHQIRWLSEFVIRSSHSGGAKIAIIDQAHLLNMSAANALLKTLEEPNDNTHLILVTDHPGRLVATIRSRCQKLTFSTPSLDVSTPWLQDCIGAGNVESLLKAAEGKPLMALSLSTGDAMQFREQFLQSLCEMKLGRKSIQQVVALASKIGETEVLEHFSTFLAKLTKYSLTGSEEGGDDPGLSGLYELLEPSQQKAQNQTVATALSRLYCEVEEARKQLASTTNPNAQLIMESILWRWSRLDIR